MNNFLNYQLNPPKNKTKVCRICASESENGQKLFNSNSQIQRIAVQICSFISIKLENIQIYPNWICPGCHLQFEATYQFFELIRNGPNKLVELFGCPQKPGRKPKRKRVHMFTVDDDQLDGSTSDNLIVEGKRISKTPSRFKDSMQGYELENLFSQIGVTNRRRRQSQTDITETIAHIEDQDGVALGEMLSIAQESQRNSTRYRCDFCKEVFLRELSFYNHLSYHKNILYECIECKAVFQAKAKLDDHLMQTNHTGFGIIETPSLKTLPANNRDEMIVAAFPKEAQVKEQAKENKIQELKKFVCIKCPKSFDTNFAMQRHQKTHSDYRPFQCDICLAKFKRKYVLKVHKTSHAKEYPFKCHICSKRFKHNQSLQLHLQGIHDGLKPYSCTICNKFFSQKSNLEIHKRIHNGDRPYICLKCGASFKTSSQCHVHQKTHSVQDPVLTETPPDSFEKSFLCKICGKLFTQRSNMRKHLRIHTGEKPYACHLCPQKFSDSSNFKKHKRNHPKEKNLKTKQLTLLKSNLTEISSKVDPPPDPDGLMAAAAPSSFTLMENVVLSNINSSLMSIMNEDDDKNTNQWNSDVIVTDIPNDENSIVQQQHQQEMLMNQLICISYQDPMNPVGSKTTFYVVNQGN